MLDLIQLKEKAKYLRQEALEMVLKAGRGHLGGSLSCVEILVALYYGGLLKFDPQNPHWEKRDRFILSKGHANHALYALLADLGFFPKTELARFSQDGGLLNGHCDNLVPGVETITGSLGHVSGIAAGMAWAAKLDGKDYLTFVILGDAECQEGSTWEAAMFANHQKLDNLIAIIDRNKLGASEFTEKTAALEPLAAKWQAFGWEVKTVNGHSIEEILAALKDCRDRKSQKPLVIIADTVKGKGISFFENKALSHGAVPREAEINLARQDLKQ